MGTVWCFGAGLFDIRPKNQDINKRFVPILNEVFPLIIVVFEFIKFLGNYKMERRIVSPFSF